jgi:DNA-binding transcriptional ArsR family regulator
MSGAAGLAKIAALIGDPARANILAALLDRRALTAGELAYAARVTAQTTSGHLAKLVQAGILTPANRQGRHRYYRLASPQVAEMLERIMVVAASGTPQPRLSSWRGGEALRNARTCYDHLAGRLGVGIADALSRRGHLSLDQDGGELTPSGTLFLRGLGVEADAGPGRPFCRPCLDWSERRPHIAGRIGAAITCRFFLLGWVTRQAEGRALTVTDIGKTGLAECFGLTLPDVQATHARAA